MNRKPKIKLNKSEKISLKRRIRLLRDRSILVTKVLLVILIYVFFFTNHLLPVKNYLKEAFCDFSGDLGFSLEKVVIKGNKNLETKSILTSLNADLGTPLFSLDLKEVHERIKDFSWVESASVRRILPNIMEIEILERKPIAIWQNKRKLTLIDAEGMIIETKKIDNFIGLLHVVGEGANYHADQLQADLSKAPDVRSNLVAAVRYGQRRWNLTLSQNITVKMPERDFCIALSYIEKLIKQGKLFDQKYKMLDLRDANKYYIEKH